MSGAWEIDDRPNVLIAILNAKDIVSIKWAMKLRELQLPHNSQVGAFSGMPFDHARNVACRVALQQNFRAVFFLDDDVVMPPDGLLRLIARELPLVSGMYPRRHVPVTPVMMRETPQGPQWITDFTPGSLVEADYVGAGALLINCRVLASLKDATREQWFEWRMDEKKFPNPEDRRSEDYIFCQTCRRAGFKIFVDTSIVCEHVGMGQTVKYDRFEPLQI